MKRILLALALIFPLGANAESSVEEAKALHMKNCLSNGGLKEICSCSFDEAVQLLPLKDIQKYNEMVAAGYTADVKTTGRLTRATMICNQKLRKDEEFRNQAAQDHGLLPPPPPPAMSGSVLNKPEPLPNASSVNTSGIEEKSYINDANKAALDKPKEAGDKPEVEAPKQQTIAPRPRQEKPINYKVNLKPKSSKTAEKRYFGEYDRVFFEASKSGNLEGLRAYAQAVTDLDVQNEIGDTALIVAARYGQKISTKFLLVNGANTNIANNKGQTALHVASYSKRLDLVVLLLRAGAEPNVSYGRGFTPLTLAIMQQDSATVKELLTSKAAVNMPRDDGNNELHIAVTGRNVDIIQQLVRAGVDKNKLNKSGNTPLMVAAYTGNLKAVQALLNLGADTNVTDQYGRTALTLAQNAGKLQVVEVLQKSRR